MAGVVSLPEVPSLKPPNQRKRVLPREIKSGQMKGSSEIRLGEVNIKIDNANRRIIINDGANDRILIGFQSGGF